MSTNEQQRIIWFLFLLCCLAGLAKHTLKGKTHCAFHGNMRVSTELPWACGLGNTDHTREARHVYCSHLLQVTALNLVMLLPDSHGKASACIKIKIPDFSLPRGQQRMTNRPQVFADSCCKWQMRQVHVLAHQEWGIIFICRRFLIAFPLTELLNIQIWAGNR